jgi:hypothetical protein
VPTFQTSTFPSVKMKIWPDMEHTTLTGVYAMIFLVYTNRWTYVKDTIPQDCTHIRYNANIHKQSKLTRTEHSKYSIPLYRFPKLHQNIIMHPEDIEKLIVRLMVLNAVFLATLKHQFYTSYKRHLYSIPKNHLNPTP